jgi:hypothetical protein
MTNEFAAKLRKAKTIYIRELRDGCNDCTKTGMCHDHEVEALRVITDPLDSPAFQAFLKEMGIVK